LHFYRKADPQSKAKIENAVKYVKKTAIQPHLLQHCTRDDEALGWRGRTANALPQAFTGKDSYSEFTIEQLFPKTVKFSIVQKKELSTGGYT
jgi:hypothetical protein